jgi:spore coat polysaccharide biosynthesis protein SpsF
MTSTRLPGKVLVDLCGESLIARVIGRLRRARRVDEVVIATTVNTTDDALVEAVERLGVETFRGDEHDVLGRYHAAAAAASADLVVRITADCPLIDPTVVDLVIERATDAARPCDYASNTIVRTYPRGLDTEVFHREVLDRMARLATSRPAREHVTYYLHREHPEEFTIASIEDSTDNSDLRWTVDTPEDLELVRQIYTRAKLTERWVPYPELLALVRRDPELLTLNAEIRQKAD